MDELLAVFNRYGDRVHVEELHNGEFDWLISFEDGQPDAYRYCIADEGCHLTYHGLRRKITRRLGFERAKGGRRHAPIKKRDWRWGRRSAC